MADSSHTSNTWGFETRQIHAGQAPDAATGARALPIYATTAYAFRDTEHAANLFGLVEPGNIYTRIMNPTQDAVEQRIASLEGGVGALLVSSGQAAETMAILNIVGAGDHIVSSSILYGGTYNLFRHTLTKLGIEVTFIDEQDNLDAWRAATRPNTKLYFGESIGNPRGDILDIAGVASVAHENDVPLIVDNTVATPYLIRPFEHGADIVVHSATKFLGGHGNAIGGVIVDGGLFDWGKSGRFPGLTEPDESYHGLQYVAALGSLAYITKARVQLLRDVGAAISPFNAFLIAQGLETLSLRMERHVHNANVIANWLAQRPEVVSVHYAGLPSSPFYEAATRYAPKGASAVLAFELDGGRDAGRKLVDTVELFSHVANIGDVRSLIIHPASTTHSQMNDEELQAAGITPGLVRLSVGLESAGDLISDLEQALAH